VLNDEFELVCQYRNYPDPKHERRNLIIEKYRSMTASLAARFVNHLHSYDDLVEFAEYQLVFAVGAAKDALADNNIRPYIINTVRLRLLEYVSFDHLMTLPSRPTSAVWDLLRSDAAPKRASLDDRKDHQCDLDEHVMLDEILDKSANSITQLDVATLRFAGYTFSDISEKTGINVKACQRLWYEYKQTVKDYYGQETMPNLFEKAHTTRSKGLSTM